MPRDAEQQKGQRKAGLGARHQRSGRAAAFQEIVCVTLLDRTVIARRGSMGNAKTQTERGKRNTDQDLHRTSPSPTGQDVQFR
jgi:hypothetical protein